MMMPIGVCHLETSPFAKVLATFPINLPTHRVSVGGLGFQEYKHLLILINGIMKLDSEEQTLLDYLKRNQKPDWQERLRLLKTNKAWIPSMFLYFMGLIFFVLEAFSFANGHFQVRYDLFGIVIFVFGIVGVVSYGLNQKIKRDREAMVQLIEKLLISKKVDGNYPVWG